MTTVQSPTAQHPVPDRPVWLLPGLMLGVTLAAVILAKVIPHWSHLFYLVPFTFLGNSLAPVPYDGAVVYLAGHHSLPLIVVVAVAATLLIEVWNMELLARVLARDGTRGFREHRVTQTTLRWYLKAPFWSLVATCVLPLVPHYPMRFLAVLAGYPMWKYLLSVILGRGARYAGLAGVGVVLPIPGYWILIVSLMALALGVRGAHRMNRAPAPAQRGGPEALPEEA